MLLQEGAIVQAYDPKGVEKVAELNLCQGAILAKSAMEATENAEALVLATEWNEFQNIDFVQVRKSMHTPIIFDGRNLFDPRTMKELGFRYFGIGRGTLIQAIGDQVISESGCASHGVTAISVELRLNCGMFIELSRTFFRLQCCGPAGRWSGSMAGKNPRLCCLKALQRWETGREFADEVLHQALQRSGLNNVNRSFVTETFYGIIRNRSYLDFIIQRFRLVRSRHANSPGSAVGGLSALQNADPGSRGRV